MSLTHGLGKFRDRMLAAISQQADSWMHRAYGRFKTELFRDLSGPILEIGAGAGANFRYLPAGSIVHAVEPNSHCHPLLQQSADRFDIELVIHDARAENLPLPDCSMANAIGSLVMCTIPAPATALAEIYRCLIPGGQFLFLEHVAGNSTGFQNYQRLLAPVWRILFGGCQLCRKTAETLENSPFDSVDCQPLAPLPRWLPIAPHIVGRAGKAGRAGATGHAGTAGPTPKACCGPTVGKVSKSDAGTVDSIGCESEAKSE